MFKSYKYKLKPNEEQIVLLNKIISSGIDDYRSGGKIRPTSVGTADETSKVLNIYNSEAQPSLVVG